MDRHEENRSINGQSVRVVRRTITDSRRTHEAGSPLRVERNCPPLLVTAADLKQIGNLVRRLTPSSNTDADVIIDLKRMIGRLAKRAST